MTNEITLPTELVHQWVDMLSSRSDQAVFTMAAQWGADQELEACVEWVSEYCPYFGDYPLPEDKLRTARRPKPPSLKEQPVAEGPTDEELWTMYDEMRREQRGLNHGDWDWVRDYARTVLAKWGHQ